MASLRALPIITSGQYSHISTEQRHDVIWTRISGHPFHNDPDRLVDLLDALAAVCIRRESGEVLSLTMDSNAATVCVSSNERRYQPPLSPISANAGVSLGNSEKVVEPDLSILADNDTQIVPSHLRMANLNFKRLFMNIHIATLLQKGTCDPSKIQCYYGKLAS